MNKYFKHKERIPIGTHVMHSCDSVPFLFRGINKDGKPLLEGDWSGGMMGDYRCVSHCEWDEIYVLNETDDLPVNKVKQFFQLC